VIQGRNSEVGFVLHELLGGLAALKARQAVSENFPETQIFNESIYNLSCFMQLNN